MAVRLEAYEGSGGNLYLVERDEAGTVTYWHDYRKDAKALAADVEAWKAGEGCSGWAGNFVRRFDENRDLAGCRLLDVVVRF